MRRRYSENKNHKTEATYLERKKNPQKIVSSIKSHRLQLHCHVAGSCASSFSPSNTLIDSDGLEGEKKIEFAFQNQAFTSCGSRAALSLFGLCHGYAF